MVHEEWLNEGDEVITEIQWKNYLRLLDYERKVKESIIEFDGWITKESRDRFEKLLKSKVNDH